MDSQTLDNFANQVKDELGLHSFRLYITNKGDLKLDMLAVPKEARKQGLGSAAMERLVKFADANGLRVILTTGVRDPHWGTTSSSRLLSFYKRFGFVQNAGRNKDFSISENMYRLPKQSAPTTPTMSKQTFKEFHQQRQEALFEAPLPDEWDDALFNERIPFAKRLRYAQERAQKMGAGSSRVVFEIPYEGRSTILKLAKNPKGMAQNEAEVQALGDWYLKNLGITIPMIDYDEKNERPTWIHVEKAQKAKDSDFKRACGGSLRDLMTFACQSAGKKGFFGGDANKVDPDSDLAMGMSDYVGSYDVPLGDLGRLANWGIYKGEPVLIDVGLSSDVLQQHYSPKPRANVW